MEVPSKKFSTHIKYMYKSKLFSYLADFQHAEILALHLLAQCQLKNYM